MKQDITKFCLFASLFIILDSIGIWRIVFEFLFIGIVPGTDERFSSSVMLMLFSVAIGLTISSIFILPQIQKYDFPQPEN